MQNSRLLLVLCTVLFASPIGLFAQGSSCEVPLVVTRFAPGSGGSELVTDLVAKDFSIKVGSSRAIVKGVSVDKSGKRIALILDASKGVSTDEWKLETQMALSLVENARASDQFSFLWWKQKALLGHF